MLSEAHPPSQSASGLSVLIESLLRIKRSSAYSQQLYRVCMSIDPSP